MILTGYVSRSSSRKTVRMKSETNETDENSNFV